MTIEQLIWKILWPCTLQRRCTRFVRRSSTAEATPRIFTHSFLHTYTFRRLDYYNTILLVRSSCRSQYNGSARHFHCIELLSYHLKWSKFTWTPYLKTLESNRALTFFSHIGTLFVRSVRMWVWMTMTARNVDSVMRIMFMQKYPPGRINVVW